MALKHLLPLLPQCELLTVIDSDTKVANQSIPVLDALVRDFNFTGMQGTCETLPPLPTISTCACNCPAHAVLQLLPTISMPIHFTVGSHCAARFSLP